MALMCSRILYVHGPRTRGGSPPHGEEAAVCPTREAGRGPRDSPRRSVRAHPPFPPALARLTRLSAFIAGLVKLTRFGALSTGDFTRKPPPPPTHRPCRPRSNNTSPRRPNPPLDDNRIRPPHPLRRDNGAIHRPRADKAAALPADGRRPAGRDRCGACIRRAGVRGERRRDAGAQRGAVSVHGAGGPIIATAPGSLFSDRRA